MPVTKRQFEHIAAFRHTLRRFLRHSEKVSRKQGVTPQQYQLMVAIIGFPKRNNASVGELAEQLQRNHHSVVELINRTERLGLVERRQGIDDRRQVFIYLTPKGERVLAKLVEEHRSEYRFLHSSLGRLLERGVSFSQI
ncbi:MAG: MarR family transcriptional regulator [Acidobacteriia bacterium]|nr:MarR family transcriptional regulator [Terriglobia bacterium]